MALDSSFKSLVQIMSIFRDLSIWHHNINDFGIGPFSDQMSRDMKYPYLWIWIDENNPGELILGDSGHYEVIDYNIIVGVYDKYSENIYSLNDIDPKLFGTNGLDVGSDILQTLYGLGKLLNEHPKYQDLQLMMMENISPQFLFDVNDGEIAFEAAFTMRSPFDGGWCAEPIDIPGFTASSLVLPDEVSIRSTICGIISDCSDFIGLSQSVDTNTSSIDTINASFSNYLELAGGSMSGDIQFTSGSIILSETTGTISTSNPTLDWSLGNSFDYVLETSATFSFTNDLDGQFINMAVTQDSVTGSNTLQFPSSVKWSEGTEPTLSTATASTDVYTLIKINGSIYGSVIQNFS